MIDMNIFSDSMLHKLMVAKMALVVVQAGNLLVY